MLRTPVPLKGTLDGGSKEHNEADMLSIPTDKLHKFISVGSLAMVVASASLIFEVDKQEAQDNLELRAKYLDQSIDRRDRFEVEKPASIDIDSIPACRFASLNTDAWNPDKCGDEAFNQLREDSKTLEQQLKIQKELSLASERVHTEAARRRPMYKKRRQIGFVGTLIFSVLAAYGFRKWYQAERQVRSS